MDECLRRAEQALAMPNSYRFGGKVVLTSYPSVREKDLPHYAELKRRLTEKFGDRFVVMPYFNLFADEARRRGPMTPDDIRPVRARLERALRVLDGLCYCGRESYFNRRYDPRLFDRVIVPIIRRPSRFLQGRGCREGSRRARGDWPSGAQRRESRVHALPLAATHPQLRERGLGRLHLPPEARFSAQRAAA